MWRRSAAFLIDLLPLGVLAGIENVLDVAHHEIVGLLNLLITVSYFAGMNYLYGGTFGKRAMGLRVALRPSPHVALKLLCRSLVKIACLAPPLATIYALVAIWSKDGRSLGDFVAGTTVVDATTLAAPKRLSLFERWLATTLAVVAPWLFLIALVLCLFGLMLVEELVKGL